LVDLYGSSTKDRRIRQDDLTNHYSYLIRKSGRSKTNSAGSASLARQSIAWFAFLEAWNPLYLYNKLKEAR
jgi:hypothetical protein